MYSFIFFFTCFGHPCAHHQEKIVLFMGLWYLIWSAGWIESNQQTRRHPYRVTNNNVAKIRQLFPDDGHMDAEKCAEEK